MTMPNTKEDDFGALPQEKQQALINSAFNEIKQQAEETINKAGEYSLVLKSDGSSTMEDGKLYLEVNSGKIHYAVRSVDEKRRMGSTVTLHDLLTVGGGIRVERETHTGIITTDDLQSVAGDIDVEIPEQNNLKDLIKIKRYILEVTLKRKHTRANITAEQKEYIKGCMEIIPSQKKPNQRSNFAALRQEALEAVPLIDPRTNQSCKDIIMMDVKNHIQLMQEINVRLRRHANNFNDSSKRGKHHTIFNCSHKKLDWTNSDQSGCEEFPTDCQERAKRSMRFTQSCASENLEQWALNWREYAQSGQSREHEAHILAEVARSYSGNGDSSSLIKEYGKQLLASPSNQDNLNPDSNATSSSALRC